MNTIYFDWSMRRGVAILRDDSDTPDFYRSLETLLNDLHSH